MQPRYPAAAPAAVAVHQQQRRASWTQGQFQASRLSLPTKTPQELQHNTKSWFPVARQQQQQQQQQQQPRNNSQQPAASRQQQQKKATATKTVRNSSHPVADCKNDWSFEEDCTV